MSRKIFLIAAFIMIHFIMIAKHSDNFLIGEYYGYVNEQELEWLSDAKFNVKRFNLGASSTLGYLQTMLSKYDNYGLDMRIKDQLWDTVNDQYGSYYATYCNWYQFQMEFTDNDPGPPDTEKWFYKIESETEYVNGPYTTIYNGALICHESVIGNGTYDNWMAVDFISSRPNMANENHLTDLINYNADLFDTYIIKWNMKWDDNEYANDDEICTLGLKVELDDNSYLVIHNLLVSADPSNYNSTTLTKENFIDNGAVGDYAEFVFTISIDALKNSLPEGRSLYWRWGSNENKCRWSYFFPTVEYKDRGTLYLDYIELSDELRDDMHPGSIVRSEISERTEDIEEYNTYDNLYAYDTFDEPFPPHFDAYKIVEDAIDNGVESHKAITAINSFGWDHWHQSAGSAEHSFYNADLFDLLAEPEMISPDFYLYSNHTWKWNDLSEVLNIQRCINRLTRYYYRIKTEVIGNSVNRKPFLPIVQTWGDWDFSYVGNGVYGKWDNLLLPPDEQQKMLLFLPLCYGADGFFTFRMTADVDINGLGEEGFDEDYCHGGHGLVDTSWEDRTRTKIIGCIVREGANWIKLDQYNAVKEANEEIEHIGYELRSKEWLGAGTIETNSLYPELEFSPNLPDLVSITVENDNDHYFGFIECGEFKDTDNDYYFMLVNRRTNYVNAQIVDGDQQYYFNVNSTFDEASSQNLTFTFSNSQLNNHNLVDQYTGDIYDIDNLQSEPIPIGPGDGMLLKLCQLPVPQEIDSSNSCTIANMYIPYDVTVQNGGSLIIDGNVEFGPNATLTIEDGGIVIIYGENRFGTNSKITVEGQLYVNPQTPTSTILTSKFNNWKGIKCLNGGAAYIENGSEIKNADIGIFCDSGTVHIIESMITNCHHGIALYNGSTLEFDASSIEVPDVETAIGINISTRINECEIQITGNPFTHNSLIQGSGTGKGTGISYRTSCEDAEIGFVCENTLFNNLHTGISHISTCNTDHIIQNCIFQNCEYGIDIFGNGGRIHTLDNCEFNNCNFGIQQNTATCDITDCDFTDCSTGIYFQNSQSPFGSSLSASGCEFFRTTGITTDIQGTDASANIDNCIFRGTRGIHTADNCSFDCATNAYNVFDCYMNNLLFHPDLPRGSSGILLINGHNDFYEPRQSPTQNLFGDMGFWGYDGSGIVIDPKNNWFENDEITIYLQPGSTLPYILDSTLDPEPNVQYTQRDITTFETALEEEYNENYLAAMNVYKSILEQPIEEEIYLWDKCIDKIFNLTMTLELSIDDLLLYYDGIFNEFPGYLSPEQAEIFERIIQNYKKKCYVTLREYDYAADIVIDRIENPINSVDSLYAVMQLETIYALSMFDSTGSTLRTIYDSFAPTSVRNLNEKHQNHWHEINKLLGICEDDENQIIPNHAVLNANYPNPFNPTTTISFSIPADSKVGVSIYNVKGQKVKTLVNDELEQGHHKIVWDSKDNSGKSVSSGVYFYKLNVNGKDKAVRKCLLLK